MPVKLDNVDGRSDHRANGEFAPFYYQLTGREMSKDSKTTLRGRDAETGEFTTVEEAREKPRTHVVERVPKPGHGDTKKK